MRRHSARIRPSPRPRCCAAEMPRQRPRRSMTRGPEEEAGRKRSASFSVPLTTNSDDFFAVPPEPQPGQGAQEPVAAVVEAAPQSPAVSPFSTRRGSTRRKVSCEQASALRNTRFTRNTAFSQLTTHTPFISEVERGRTGRGWRAGLLDLGFPFGVEVGLVDQLHSPGRFHGRPSAGL